MPDPIALDHSRRLLEVFLHLQGEFHNASKAMREAEDKARAAESEVCKQARRIGIAEPDDSDLVALGKAMQAASKR